MQSFNIGKATFSLLEQFIVEAKLTWYEQIKVVHVEPNPEEASAYTVTFHSYDDSSFHDTVTVEALDLMAYIAEKSGIITTKD